jgi:type I restriction-modification system DNA methylase subunit
MGEYGVSKIFAQEKNITTYNLARMNMLLHGVKDNEFNIYHGDSLTNEWGILSEVRKICNALGDFRNNYAKFVISLSVTSTQFFRI